MYIQVQKTYKAGNQVSLLILVKFLAPRSGSELSIRIRIQNTGYATRGNISYVVPLLW